MLIKITYLSLIALLLVVSSCSTAQNSHEVQLVTIDDFKIDEKSLEIVSEKQLDKLLQYGVELTNAILSKNVNQFSKYIKSSYLCVDRSISAKELKDSLNDKKLFNYNFLFNPDWKKEFITYDDRGYTLHYKGGGTDSGVKESEPVGFAEYLANRTANQKFKVYAHAFKYNDGKSSWIEGYIQYVFVNPINHTELSFAFDKNEEKWVFTGNGWDCRD